MSRLHDLSCAKGIGYYYDFYYCYCYPSSSSSSSHYYYNDDKGSGFLSLERYGESSTNHSPIALVLLLLFFLSGHQLARSNYIFLGQD